MEGLLGLSSLRSVAITVSLCAAAPAPVPGQAPPPKVSLGFGVDTTIVDTGNIVRLVRAYLADPDSSARSKGLWTTSTEFDRRFGDVTAGETYLGFPATIAGIISAGPGDSVYIVKILYANGDSARGIEPLALQRLYAVRDARAPFAFKLAGAFPRVTKDWERRSKGPLTFLYAPGQHPNQARINLATRFVDSVAKMFDVPPPTHLDVIVGGSMDDVNRALGWDFYVEDSGPGQRSGGRNLGSIILTGNPAIGEAYFHEFVHAILGAHIRAGSRLLAESIPTWLGGSRGRTPHEMYQVVRKYQLADSTLSLTRLFRSGFRDDDNVRAADLLYGSGALIANAVYRRAGIAGVRRVYQLSGDANTLLRGIASELGLPPGDDAAVDRWWRDEAAAQSSRPVNTIR